MLFTWNIKPYFIWKWKKIFCLLVMISAFRIKCTTFKILETKPFNPKTWSYRLKARISKHLGISINIESLIVEVCLQIRVPKSKWAWSGNTTITHCRQTHGTVSKSHWTLTVTRHQENNFRLHQDEKLILLFLKQSLLFLNQNICCGYSKEPSQWDGSCERPKHMFKLMDNKIITILCSKLLLILTYEKCKISV